MISSVNRVRNVVTGSVNFSKKGITVGNIVGLSLGLILGFQKAKASPDGLVAGIIMAFVPMACAKGGAMFGGVIGFVTGFAKGVFCESKEPQANRGLYSHVIYIKDQT